VTLLAVIFLVAVLVELGVAEQAVSAVLGVLDGAPVTVVARGGLGWLGRRFTGDCAGMPPTGQRV
jgi:hypothetical protein